MLFHQWEYHVLNSSSEGPDARTSVSTEACQYLECDAIASDIIMKTGNFIVQGIGIVAVVDNILREGQLNGRSNAINYKSFSGISACNAIFGVGSAAVTISAVL